MRRVGSLACCLFGTVCLVLGVVARFVDEQLFDTGQVADTAAEMLELDSVRELLRVQLDQRIEPMVQAEFVPLVDPVVVAVLDDPRFAAVLDEAVRSTHRTLVGGSGERIVFSLAGVIPFVRAEFEAVDPALAAQLPPLDGMLDYVFVQRSELPLIWKAVERFHRVAVSLVVFGVLLIALGLVIGPARWALLIIVGVLLALSSLIVAGGAWAFRRTIQGRIDAEGTKRAAADLIELFTDPLDREMTTLLVVGGLFVAAGAAVWLLRPRPRRRPVRSLAADGTPSRDNHNLRR